MQRRDRPVPREARLTLTTISVRHIEGYQVEAVGATHAVRIDLPTDRGGDGAGMAIGEAFLGSLGACTLLTVLHYCRANELQLTGIRIDVSSDLAEHPKRIGRIVQRLTLEGDLTSRQRETLERVAHGCSIHNTLRMPPELVLELAVAPGTSQPSETGIDGEPKK